MKLVIPVAAVATFFAASANAQQFGAHFMEMWDLDADGQVTLSEAVERRDDIFTAFDADEDNMLNPPEYAEFDVARAADRESQDAGHGMQMVQGAMERQYNDANSDGQVSREEFNAKSELWFQNMDKSGDGIVTPDDFGPRRD